MTSIVIKTAGLRDLKTLQHLEKEAFGDDAWPLLELIACLTFPGEVRLKAVIGEELVGYVGGSVEFDRQLGWITTIAVFNQWRRQGIGVALLRACEQKLHTPRIHLCVRVNNIPAQEMYKREGYSQIETWKKYYHDGEDAFVMEKSFST
jgi:ribosomal-protein-alanine N-acetyltransferase